jgi:hypothetical protein
MRKPQTASPSARWLRMVVLFLIPILAYAAWRQVRHPERVFAPWSPHEVVSLIYDEYDLTAMALRGWNAERGRQAGWPENPAYDDDDPFDQQLNVRSDLNERYFLEYPHAALLIFRAGFWLQPQARDLDLPPAIADADYHDLATFEPCTPQEKSIWRCFVRATDFYAAVMFGCLLALIAVMHVGYGAETGLKNAAWWLLLPAALFFTFNRYDIVPALLTAICLACVGRRWVSVAAFFLGCAVLVKVYPILFVPLIHRYLWTRRRESIRFGAVFGATMLLAFAPMLFGADLKAIIGPYRFQLTRPPEGGMTIYGCLLPAMASEGWFGTVFRLGTLASAMGLLVLYPIESFSSLLRRCVLILMVFVSLAVFYSPQWVLWFAPLLFPLLTQDRRLSWSWVTLDLVTYMTFPIWFWILPHCHFTALDDETNRRILKTVGSTLRIARFVVCGGIIFQLVIAEWPWLIRKSWLGRLLPQIATILARKE